METSKTHPWRREDRAWGTSRRCRSRRIKGHPDLNRERSRRKFLADIFEVRGVRFVALRSVPWVLGSPCRQRGTSDRSSMRTVPALATTVVALLIAAVISRGMGRVGRLDIGAFTVGSAGPPRGRDARPRHGAIVVLSLRRKTDGSLMPIATVGSPRGRDGTLLAACPSAVVGAVTHCPVGRDRARLVIPLGRIGAIRAISRCRPSRLGFGSWRLAFGARLSRGKADS